MKRGVTLLEVLIVMGIVVAVMGGVFMAMSGGSRVTRVSSSTAALQSAMLLTEALYRDIAQLGVDTTSARTLEFSDSSLCFYKCKFDGDRMLLVPLKFSRVKSPKGNYFLKREELGAPDKTFGSAPCTELSFTTIQDPNFHTQYLKVMMKVLEQDLAPGPARRDPLPHSAIMRIPVPSQVGLPALQAIMKIVPEGPLMAVDP